MNIKPNLSCFRIFCLIFLLAGCGFTESSVKREKDSEARYKLGIDYLNDSPPNLQKAYIEFLEAIKIDPKNKGAHYGLGHIYAQRQDYLNAIPAFKNAISIDPTYSEAHNYLGKVYETMGRDTEAIASYHGALKNLQYATPQLPHWNLAQIYIRQKQYDKALEALQEVRRIEPANGVVLDKIAETHTQKGDLDNARSFFKEAVALAPNDPRAHFRLASFYLEKGPRELASEEFQKVIALSPQSTEADAARKSLEALK